MIHMRKKDTFEVQPTVGQDTLGAMMTIILT